MDLRTYTNCVVTYGVWENFEVFLWSIQTIFSVLCMAEANIVNYQSLFIWIKIALSFSFDIGCGEYILF
jgi:hypothetical protein